MVKGPFKYNLKYLGLSTDTKPTNVSAGSRFYETNTGLWFIFTGATWTSLS